MQCPNCGFDNPNYQPFCPNCGAGLQTPVQNSAAGPILAVLKDNLFMVLCILVSASCILSLAAGSIPLLQILAAVFLWLIYARATKDEADDGQLRNLSGTIFAHYIITFVTAGLVVVLGMLFSLGLSILLQDPTVMDTLIQEIAQTSGLDSYTAEQVRQMLEALGAVPTGIFTVVFLICGILITVLNIFSIRYIHRFVKSVYRSLQNGRLELDCGKAAQIWLWIFGIFGALSALGSLGESLTLVSGLASGCTAATYIIAAILVGKLLNPAPVQPPQF